MLAACWSTQHCHCTDRGQPEGCGRGAREGVGHLVAKSGSTSLKPPAAANAPAGAGSAPPGPPHEADASTRRHEGAGRLLGARAGRGGGDGLESTTTTPPHLQRAAFAAHVRMAPSRQGHGRHCARPWPCGRWTRGRAARVVFQGLRRRRAGRGPGGRGRLVRVVRGHGHLPQRPRAAGRLRRGPARPDGAGDRQPVPLPSPLPGPPQPARPGRGHRPDGGRRPRGPGRAGRERPRPRRQGLPPVARRPC